MRKFLLLLSVSVFLIGIVYASPFYPQSKTLDFKESCTSAGAICNSSALCNVSIKYPNLSYVINNGVMTNNNNGDFNYTLNASSTSTTGIYSWDMYCCQAGICGEGHDTFTINSIGLELTTSKSIVYGFLFFIVLFFFILLLFIIGR